jgi:hypothetical protein
MTTLTARKITAAVRGLFPHIKPLSTSRQLSSNGMVLSYNVAMPRQAAVNWGVGNASGQVAAERYLTGQLGVEVHIADVVLPRGINGDRLAHVVIKRGAHDEA